MSASTEVAKTAEDQRNARSKRSRWIINDRFQLKYTLWVTGGGVGLAGILGALLYSKVRENSELLQGMPPQFQEVVQASDTHMLYWLLAFVLLMGVGLFFWGIVVTHRIAGPIYFFNRLITELAKGNYPDTRPLRKKDEFKDFGMNLQEVVGLIKQRDQEEYRTLADVLARLERQNIPASDLNALKELAGKKQRALAD